MHSVGFVAVILSPALVAVSVISSQCCPQLLLRNFKRSGSRSGVGRVVRCSIYYPALLAARMTERCATKLSVSTPVPLSDLLTKMRRRSAEDWNLGNLEVWKWFTSAIQLISNIGFFEDQCYKLRGCVWSSGFNWLIVTEIVNVTK